MSFETLLYEVRDGVAHITLNREKQANAVDLQMSKDLMYAADLIAAAGKTESDYCDFGGMIPEVADLMAELGLTSATAPARCTAVGFMTDAQHDLAIRVASGLRRRGEQRRR